MKYLTNLQIAELFRKMAAAYQILNENRFKIIAYERAADSVEHLTSEVKDLWDDGKLSEIPGVGSTIVGHLDELFRTGKIRHFENVMAKVPQAVFPLLSIAGVGPKKAYTLVTELHLHNEKTVIADLEKAIKKGKVAPLTGFGEKSESELSANIGSYKRGTIKENRILLSEADVIAADLQDFLLKKNYIKQVDVLGSLRRQVATIGDIDLSIVTDEPQKATEYFTSYPNQKIIEQGPTGASILLHNGRQVDMRVGDKASYGAMLQYFTGSKNHNIALRTYALSRGLSLSEYGIKKVHSSEFIVQSKKKTEKKEKIIQFDTEEKFYQYLGMEWIPPELREDRGEIQASTHHELPELITLEDICGDLHLHTSFDLEPSHDLGVNTIEKMLDTAWDLGYSYIGISDHNPSAGNHTDKQIIEIMKRRQEFYREHTAKWNQKKKKNISVFIMLEVDIQPEGDLALPDGGFDFVDAVIASIHSSFGQEKAEMAKRIERALTGQKKVKILGHPTGRFLGRREGYDADWKYIFSICASRHIACEINASPYRLDLPDALVFDARKMGVQFVINTDAHAAENMAIAKYGVSVARRGWCTKRDIVNTIPYNEIRGWLTNNK